MINLLIDGKRTKSSSGETRNIIHPANGQIVEIAQEASTQDVEIAIKSARKSFDSGVWSKTSNSIKGLFEQINVFR